jgi:hypothetical protein
MTWELRGKHREGLAKAGPRHGPDVSATAERRQAGDAEQAAPGCLADGRSDQVRKRGRRARRRCPARVSDARDRHRWQLQRGDRGGSGLHAGAITAGFAAIRALRRTLVVRRFHAILAGAAGNGRVHAVMLVASGSGRSHRVNARGRFVRGNHIRGERHACRRHDRPCTVQRQGKAEDDSQQGGDAGHGRYFTSTPRRVAGKTCRSDRNRPPSARGAKKRPESFRRIPACPDYFGALIGGGGRNRTAVRRHSMPGTTCLARCSISDGGNTTCEAHRHPHPL